MFSKSVTAGVAVAFTAALVAPAVQAGQLADDLNQAGKQAGAAANQSGKAALKAAGAAIAPVVYAGKAVINGVEFVLLKTAQGTIMVAEAAVRGIEFAVEGAKFVALKTAEGLVWVAEKAVIAGTIILDAVAEGVEMMIDGTLYVAARVADGVVFVAKATWEAAKATGELVVRGVKFVAKQTAKGIVFVAKTAKSAARAARRAALVTELRGNLVTALGVGGVSPRTMTYFQRRAGDRDPRVARLGKACLAAAAAFNDVY